MASRDVKAFVKRAFVFGIYRPLNPSMGTPTFIKVTEAIVPSIVASPVMALPCVSMEFLMAFRMVTLHAYSPLSLLWD
jgi:hypothetical protein